MAGMGRDIYVINDTVTKHITLTEKFKMVVPLQNYSGHFTFMPAHIVHWGRP